jgi:hypothetical protein
MDSFHLLHGSLRQTPDRFTMAFCDLMVVAKSHREMAIPGNMV